MLIHVAEIAVALFLAYMAGWLIGYVAHRLAAPTRKPAVAATELAAASVEAQPAAAAVAAEAAKEPTPKPVVEAAQSVAEVSPAAETRPPSMTAEIVIPKAVSFEPLLKAATEPAKVQGVTPANADDLTALWPADAAVTAEVEAAPLETVVTEVPVEFAAVEVEPKSVETAIWRVEPIADAPPEPPPAPAAAAPEAPIVSSAAPAASPGLAWSGEIKGHAAVKHEAPPPPGTKPEPPVPPAVPRVDDEDAAMRAIESGWSRRSARALPGAPELSDVGAAVAAATSAVEKALKELEPDTAKSRRKDNDR